MKKTALTYRVLDRFESLVNPDTLTPEQVKEVEHDAYCACMVAGENHDITEWGWFSELVKKYVGIDLEALEAAQEATEEAQDFTIYEEAAALLEARKDRSAWGRGVTAYALELMEQMEESARYNGYNPANRSQCREFMLNGAQDWQQASWGGCFLCYDGQIAERLCNPSELKRTRHGERRPNSREEWLDTQARALGQACARAASAYLDIIAKRQEVAR